MKLKRLELVNVCLHRHFEIDFEDGLIGFFGPQGSGKTTAVNAAYAALTNDYSRFTGGKTGVPRQQTEAHEPSKIVLQAEHAGRPFTLTRTLQPSSKHSLTWPGLEKPLTKATEIDEKLVAIMGGDRHLLDKYVFVPQWGLRDLFNLTAAERAKTLSHLCGTQQAEACWELLGKQWEADSRLAVTVVDNSDQLRQQIGTCRSRLETAQAELDAVQPDLLTEQEIAAAQSLVNHEQRILDAVSQMNAATVAEATKKQVAVKAVAAFKAAIATRDQLQLQLQEAVANWEHDRDALQAFNDYKKQYDDWRQQQAEIVTLTQELASAKAPVSPASGYVRSDIDDNIAEIRGRLATPEATIAKLSGLKNLDAGATCDTCGQPLTDPKKHLEEALACVAPLRASLKVWQQRLAEYTAFQQALRSYENSLALRRQRLDDKKAKVAQATATKAPVAPCDAAGVETLKLIADDLRHSYNETCKHADVLQQAKATAIASHQAAKAEVARLGLVLGEAKGDAVYEEARSKLAKHSQAAIAAARSEATVQECALRLREEEERLAALSHVLASGVKARGWVELLGKVRNVVHRDALPRIVHEAALRRMETGINETLESFESPFTVKTSAEDLSYVAYFRNGTIMPAQGLSGGQQVVLSLALRWTLNSLFASQIGMLVLDEPTAGLDARHIDLLEIALQGLGKSARARGCQVLIITHERRLEGVFDQIVELERIVT